MSSEPAASPPPPRPDRGHAHRPDRRPPREHAVASGLGRTVLDTSLTIDAHRRREAEQAAAARLSQKALRDTSLAELLDDATFTLADTLAVEQSTVLLFDDDESDRLVLVAGYGDIAARVGSLRVPTVGSVGGLALTRREPVTCHASIDGYRFPGSRHLMASGIESTIAVAIEGPDHAFGVLGAHSLGWREFNRDDELFVQTVANVVGAAILRDRTELALIEAEEAERRRIAEAVHDDTLQVMIAIALRLETLGREAGDERFRETIRDLVTDTRGAATRLRSLAFDLFPEDLAVGLEVVVRRLLEESSRDGGFAFDLAVDLSRPPPDVAARTIYRNTQEAIVNIRKHARAASVGVVLRSDRDGTTVRIVDDGVGISPRAAAAGVRGHLGIKGLRDRTIRCGGRVHIGPGPTRGAAGGERRGGTTVEFWIPDAPRRRGRGGDPD
jgi:signal transduction histidine kinase